MKEVTLVFRFKFYSCCCVVFLATFFTVVFGSREHGVHLSSICLNSRRSSPDKLPVIMLHSISDTKETWDGIYQKIPSLTGRKVCIYDARDHGDSSWNNTFDIDTMAEDLEGFMNAKNMKKASLVGHNMGALTIMKFALNNPSRVESIFVEDIPPKLLPDEIYEEDISFFRVLLESISEVPRNADRKTVVKVVRNYVLKATGQPAPEYLFKKFPFRRSHGRWQWKANFELFITSFEDPSPWTGKIEGLFKGRAFFIYGTASEMRLIDDKEHIRTLFPKAQFFGVEGADNYIHPDFPEFSEKLIEFLNRQDRYVDYRN